MTPIKLLIGLILIAFPSVTRTLGGAVATRGGLEGQ